MGPYWAEKGRYREALDNTTRALQLRPNDAMAHRNVAMINNQIGDNHLALKHNLEAIRTEVKTIGDPHARDSKELS